MEGQQKPHLTGVAVEILMHIFGELGTATNAVLLASTCKHLYNIWNENKDSIVWSILKKDVVAFEDALLTIRVTHIADAYIARAKDRKVSPKPRSQGTEPHLLQRPNFDLPGMTSHVRKPTLEELMSVQDLYLLVSCAIGLGTAEEPDDYSSCHRSYLREYIEFPPDGLETLPYSIYPNIDYAVGNERDLEIHNYRIYRSLYWVFLSGAMLAPAYLAPFLNDSDRTKYWCWDEDKASRVNIWPRIESEPTEEEKAYLREYIPYKGNLMSSEETQEFYGPLLQFLLDRGATEILLDTEAISHLIEKGSEGSNFSDEYRDRSALHQVLMLFTAEEILRRLFANALPAEESLCSRGALPQAEYSAFKGRSGQFKNYRTMRLIFYGIYEPEELSFPAYVSEVTTNTWLLAEGTCRSQDRHGNERKHRLVMDMPDLLGRHCSWGAPCLRWSEVNFFFWAVKSSPGGRRLGTWLFNREDTELDLRTFFFENPVFCSLEDARSLLTDNVNEEEEYYGLY